MAASSVVNEIETYGAMIVGFLSIEFLKGWFGLVVMIGSGLLVWYKFFRLVIGDIRARRKKEKGKKRSKKAE